MSGNDRGDDRADIDELVRRFFSAFCNRGVHPRVAELPSMFLPGAAITVVRPGAAVETCGVADFVTPRAALLSEGRLREFEEPRSGLADRGPGLAGLARQPL